MNKGVYSGAGSKPVVGFGKTTYGIDYQNKDYVPVLGQKTYVANAPADLKKAFPKITLRQWFTPFIVVDIIWTGTVWAAIGKTQFSTTTDFVTWTTPVTLPANTGYSWCKLGYNGSQYVVIGVTKNKTSPFIAVGTNIYTAYSSTGATWSAGTTLSGYCASSGAFVSNLIWDGTAWVASIMQRDPNQTDFGGLIRSTNGSTWATVSNYNGFDMRYVSGNSSMLVAVMAPTYTAIKSTDHGATWSLYGYVVQPHPFSYTGGQWVVSRPNGKLVTSANGTTWTGVCNPGNVDDNSMQACVFSPVVAFGNYWLRAYATFQGTNSYGDTNTYGYNLLSVNSSPDLVPVVYEFEDIPLILNGVYAANNRAFMYSRGCDDDDGFTNPFIAEVIIDPNFMQVPAINWGNHATNLYMKVK